MSVTPPPPDSNLPQNTNYPQGPASSRPDEGRWVQVRAPYTPPYVTYALLAFTILVYLWQVASGYITGQDWPGTYGMKVNSLIIQGQYWRLITAVFLHGSPLHIGFNMYALYIFGPGLERHYKHLRYLLLYLLSGFAGNVFSFIFSTNPSLGSSTAIFGLIGAEGVFLYQNRKLFAGSYRTALTQIVMIAAINLAIGLSPGIDNWGHVGGLLGGLVFAWLSGPILRVEGIAPSYHLQDQRTSKDVILATVAVGSFFALLTVVTIYMRVVQGA